MSDQDPAATPDEQPRPGPPGDVNEPRLDAPAGADPATEPEAEAGTGTEPEPESETGSVAESEAADQRRPLPAWVGRDRELEAARRARRERRRPLLVAAVIVLLIGVWGWRVVTRHEPGRTPAETVTAFFDAQRAGDCELLADLLTEASWSQDGEWTRDEFVGHCTTALVDYRPVRGPVAIVLTVDGDEYSRPTEEEADGALVRIGGNDSALPEGTVVREDGQWRIETDERVLAVGGSIADRMQGYVAAYNAGDCDALRRLLAEPTWSRDGELTAEEFTERCAEELGRSPEEGSDDEGDDGDDGPRPLVVDGAEVGSGRDGRDERHVAIRVHRDGDMPLEEHTDQATFVREGLTWRLAGLSSGSPEDQADPADAIVPGLEWVELQDLLVDEIMQPEESCNRYEDGTAPRAGIARQSSGVTRDFESCFLGVRVSLRRYPDDAAAREAAENLVASELADPPTTADDLTDTLPALDPADAERAAGTYRPNVEAPVPGFDDALGVRTGCSTSGCSGASVHAVRGGLLVSVEVEYGDSDMATAVANLRAQLERLS